MQVEACISSNLVLTLFEKSFLLKLSNLKSKQKSLWISRSIEFGIKTFPMLISPSVKFRGLWRDVNIQKSPSKFGKRVCSEK